jgi:hypothetical protein
MFKSPYQDYIICGKYLTAFLKTSLGNNSQGVALYCLYSMDIVECGEWLEFLRNIFYAHDHEPVETVRFVYLFV